MIKYLLFFAALLPVSLIAQNTVDGKVGYSEVVEVKGATAATFTDRANTFMKIKKIEPKTVGNVISGTGAFKVTYTSVKKGSESGYVKFAIKIMVKDGKYKVDLSNFIHEGIQGMSSGGSIDLERAECGDAQILHGSWIKIKEQTQEQLTAFVKELKTKMDNPVKAAPTSTTDF